MSAGTRVRRHAVLRKQRLFPIVFLMACGAIFGAVIGVNFLVDPLWYNSGNKLREFNNQFNERISKINLVVPQIGQYDCILFGSSAATLVNTTKIRDHTCFNAAFADAQPDEYVVYARYLRALGLSPRVVIVSVGSANFRPDRVGVRYMPEFVRRGEAPPTALQAYASFDVFWFSVRSIVGSVPQKRHYDSRFVSDLRPDVPIFKPARELTKEIRHDRFETTNLDAYRELLSVFPDARSIGFVPLVNAWRVLRWSERGMLESYFDVMHTSSKLFDRFWDFTVPSNVTTNPHMTYDGSHYSSAANDVVADTINGDGNPSAAIAVHMLSRDAYERAYRNILRAFHDTLATSES